MYHAWQKRNYALLFHNKKERNGIIHDNMDGARGCITSNEPGTERQVPEHLIHM